MPRFYRYYADTAEAAEATDGCTVQFTLEDGPSVDTGGSQLSGGGDYAVTFFDWDGRVIDAIPAPQDITQDETATARMTCLLYTSRCV